MTWSPLASWLWLLSVAGLGIDLVRRAVKIATWKDGDDDLDD